MKIRYTRGALDDLDSIIDYLQSRNPAAMLRVREDIHSTVDLVSRFPLSGREQDIAGVRNSVTPRHGYLVFYAANDSESVIDILAVQHAAQNRAYRDS